MARRLGRSHVKFMQVCLLKCLGSGMIWMTVQAPMGGYRFPVAL